MRVNVNAFAAAARLATLCQSGAAPQAVWSSLDSVLAEVFGHRLFTVLLYDGPGERLVRVYSSRLDINPVGGVKPVTPSIWTTRVLIEGQPYIGSSKADLRDVFADFEVLWAIGCESVLNIPIRHSGHVLGSLNLLDGPANYVPADVDAARLFAQLGTTAALEDFARVLGDRSAAA